MSKRYKREENQLDRLEKENRQLKALNKSLLKRLRKVSKGYNRFLMEEAEEEKQEALDEVGKEVDKTCWDCGGDYKIIKILDRRWRQCQGCQKRGKVKIISGQKV